jgi:hypothetical protein
LKKKAGSGVKEEIQEYGILPTPYSGRVFVATRKKLDSKEDTTC